MGLRTRVEEVLEALRPRLEYLSEGYAELISLDEQTGRARLRLYGGRLH